MRQIIDFYCNGDLLAATLDAADKNTGLLIVSGGNEIRSGAYSGQAALAQHFAQQGYPVFRYDRRGVGDSEGLNRGFECSAEDIAAAVAAFRAHVPSMTRVVALGVCDAATALVLFHDQLCVDELILANPWVIETADTEQSAPTPPSAAAIRARYLARLKNPRSLFDLLTGKIDLHKLASGLGRATRKDAPTRLAAAMAGALERSIRPVHILIAARDTTAMAFMGAWRSGLFAPLHSSEHVDLVTFDTPSHSFADSKSKAWFLTQIESVLRQN
ncbi:MAG: hydrolase 1, exosortase A system-associated [Sphingorhabdus sp.]